MGSTQYVIQENSFLDHERENEALKWFTYVMNGFKRGYVYEKGIEKLKKMGCHDYDFMIALEKKKLQEKLAREQNSSSKPIAFTEKKILCIPALDGMSGRPLPGSTIRVGESDIKVLTSMYFTTGGREQGLEQDDYYKITFFQA